MSVSSLLAMVFFAVPFGVIAGVYAADLSASLQTPRVARKTRLSEVRCSPSPAGGHRIHGARKPGCARPAGIRGMSA